MENDKYVDVVASFNVASFGRVRMQIEDSSQEQPLAWIMSANVAEEWAKKLAETAKDAWDMREDSGNV